jgi:anti-anti-sigma factor
MLEDRLTPRSTHHGTPGLQLVRLPADPAPVLVVSGALDVYETPHFRAALFEIVDEGHDRVVVDCMGITFIDSSGLGVLVDASRRMQERDGSFVVRHVPAATRRLFELAGVGEFFEFDG